MRKIADYINVQQRGNEEEQAERENGTKMGDLLSAISDSEHRNEFAGQWVAVFDGKIIAHDNDASKVVERVEEENIVGAIFEKVRLQKS